MRNIKIEDKSGADGIITMILGLITIVCTIEAYKWWYGL